MFFTNWGDTPKLESTALDGSSRVLLVNKRIVRPYAITLDYVNKHVYWSDTYLDRVERIDYYGDNRKHVIHGQMVSPVRYWLVPWKIVLGTEMTGLFAALLLIS